MLDEKERAFLLGIQDNPLWRSILKKMSEFSTTPRYQKSLSDDKQVQNWIYMSGRLDERESLISLLSLSKEKIKLEK